MKRPGIPARGVAYNRAAATAVMASQVRVQRPSVPEYDVVTGYAIGVKADYSGYAGKAHIRPSSSGGNAFSGDQLVALMTVAVSIPFDATPIPREEDQVVVLACEDPALVGKTLRIIDVSSGGIGFPVRTLTCTFVEDNPFNTTA